MVGISKLQKTGRSSLSRVTYSVPYDTRDFI